MVSPGIWRALNGRNSVRYFQFWGNAIRKRKKSRSLPAKKLSLHLKSLPRMVKPKWCSGGSRGTTPFPHRLIFRPNCGPKGRKKIFGVRPPPPPLPPSQGLDDRAPPLSEGLDTTLWCESYQQSVSFALPLRKSNQNPHRLVCHCLAKQSHCAVN